MSTSSTRDSERFRLVLGAIASVGLVAVLVTSVLHRVAVWAEREASSYPWRNEDYLRYLVPTLFGGGGRNTILLAGPSEAREDLLYEVFEEAFPGTQTVQAGLSLGTFDDLLIALDYWRRVFGADAVPRTLVIGVTPRFVANLPRRQRPLARSITRYSPRFDVRSAPYGSSLVEKRPWQSLLARVRFLEKQPGRYRAALCTVFLRSMLGSRPEAFTPLVAPAAQSFETPLTRRRPSLARLERCRSPYRYRLDEATPVEVIEDYIRSPDSFWFASHHWNPDDDAAQVRAQFDRLRTIAAQLGLEVFVVNLPEHPLSRVRYQPGAYERYLELVQESIEPTHFLELRDLLPASEFHDAGHATGRGAVLVTDTAVAFLRKLHGDDHFARSRAGRALSTMNWHRQSLDKRYGP